MGELYNADANDIYALEQRLNERLGEVNRGVGDYPDEYPADYMYHPIRDKNGDPMIVKIDDQYLIAVAKREQEGHDFNQIVLLTRPQLDAAYWQRPDAKPDVEGEPAKKFMYDKKETYVVESEDSKLKANTERYWQEESATIVSHQGFVMHPQGGTEPSFEIDKASTVGSISNLRYPEPEEFTYKMETITAEELQAHEQRALEAMGGNKPAPTSQDLFASIGLGNVVNPQTPTPETQKTPETKSSGSDVTPNAKVVNDVVSGFDAGSTPDKVAKDVISVLYDGRRDNEQFQADAHAVISVFRDKGHGAYADILEKFAEADGSRDARNVARQEIKDIHTEQYADIHTDPEPTGDKTRETDAEYISRVAGKMDAALSALEAQGINIGVKSGESEGLLQQNMNDSGTTPDAAEQLKQNMTNSFQKLSECMKELPPEQRMQAAQVLSQFYENRDRASTDVPTCDDLVKP